MTVPVGTARMACLVAAGLCLATARVAPGEAQPALQFRDVTAESGIAFQHTDGSGGRYYIVEYVSSGLATFDSDGDGRIDIYFLNGAPLPGTDWRGPPPRNRLYRNRGGWRFEDVTEQAGVGDTGFGLGVTAADYDNDGWADLYVNNFGPNRLFHNRGEVRFEDATAAAGVGRGNRVGAGVNFLDVDGDGMLDLFVSNYVQSPLIDRKPHTLRGFPAYPSPLDFQPEINTLFHQQPDGRFVDVTDRSGIGACRGTGMGTVCADFDGDGDTDIFVANDVMASFLFENDGHGRFREGGVSAGVAYEAGGIPHGNMGADAGDYDNDGRLDLFVTSYHREMPSLYRNLGNRLFDDVTRVARAGQSSFPHVKWGCTLADFDNDGHKDIFMGCGHLMDKAELIDDTTSYQVRPILLRNTGKGRFVDISDKAGEGLQQKLVARGVAFDDLDNDGDLDVVVLNSRRPATLLRNMLRESRDANHWLQVELRGVKTNRDGVGAQVRTAAGDLVQSAEVHSGRSYQSHFGTRLHFGLGSHARVDRIEVRWIGGGTDLFEDLPVDRLVTLVEGSGTR